MELLHIYAKEGIIKLIPESKNWTEGELLIEKGYVFIKELNPVKFIEYLHNHCQPDEVYKEVENLICPF